MIKVLFVCLGNICRSPLAEGLLLKKIQENKLEGLISVDSCGTSDFHIGELPDERTLKNARQNGLILKHRGRQFTHDDFKHFHRILVMDASNQQNVLKLAKTKEDVEKVKLIRYYEADQHLKNIDVPDPYYGGEKGFQDVYDILDRSTDNLLLDLRQELNS
ncbi:protein tyrosine phosphatase [Marivirga lumbricoides]|uniref:protein-tyrosine-phosphatase n=1 Tax=Marivirga lumbricoides TaxID=1046115 RepID=A0A2T4DMZ0_9BACT|nr:protein tyrosine phosphatase [Marivirga lumbricoides]